MAAPRAPLSFLCDPSPASTPAPAPKKVTDTDRVREFLRAHADWWHTSVEIAAGAGISLSRVNGCVYGLVKRGQVDRNLPVQRHWRTQRGQTYRWRASS